MAEVATITTDDWTHDSEGYYHRPCDLYSIDGQCPGCYMTIPPPVEYRLTRKDINALKKANDICFDHDRKSERSTGRSGAIRAIKKKTLKEREEHPFDSDSVTYTIELTESSVTVYGDMEYAARKETAETVRGFSMLRSGYEDDILTTIWSLLRPGDVIRLRWYYNAGSQVVANVNLHTDQLYLEIVRRGKSGEKKMKFFIDEQTGLDNSARMLRQQG